MQNFSEAQKEALQALVEAGADISMVVYNPGTVVGTPEADAVADGWVQYYREDTASLVEIVYTR